MTTVSEQGATARDRAITRPVLLGELLIVAFLVLAYDHVRGMAASRHELAVHDAHLLLTAERLLHLDVELPANLWLSAHHALATLASWYYQVLHLSVTMALLALCYWRRPDGYRRARNALVGVSVVGLAIFWFFPVAPPRLLPGGGYVDTTIAVGVAEPVNSTVGMNPYAAMPSLHLAWATWVALVALLVVRSRASKALWLGYPVATGVVVVGTGNHWTLDLLAGVGVALVMAQVTGLATLSWRGLAGRGAAVAAGPRRAVPSQARGEPEGAVADVGDGVRARRDGSRPPGRCGSAARTPEG